jgi:hypothetical protein
MYKHKIIGYVPMGPEAVLCGLLWQLIDHLSPCAPRSLSSLFSIKVTVLPSSRSSTPRTARHDRTYSRRSTKPRRHTAVTD